MSIDVRAGTSSTLRIATAGDYDQFLPKLNLAQRQVPIVVRLPDASRTDLALLGELTVPALNDTTLQPAYGSTTFTTEMSMKIAPVARMHATRVQRSWKPRSSIAAPYRR